MDERSLRKRIEEIRAEIVLARADTVYADEPVEIVAASKTVAVETLSLLKGFGIGICAENKVQEFREKQGKFETDWHFIGRLQTNKVKYLVGAVSVIQSVDSEEILCEIERQAERKGVPNVSIMIEVNLSDEEQKGGVRFDDVEAFLRVCKKYGRISVCGLMSVIKNAENVNENYEYYRQLRLIYDKINSEAILRGERPLSYLSMGMSNDYAVAVKAGANMVRLGRALFGERTYSQSDIYEAK